MKTYVLVLLVMLLASCAASDRADPVADRDPGKVVLTEDAVVLSNETLDSIRSFEPAQARVNDSSEDAFPLVLTFEGTPDGTGSLLLTRRSSAGSVEVTSSSVFSIVRGDIVTIEVSDVAFGSRVYRSPYESSQFLMDAPKTFTITYEPVN